MAVQSPDDFLAILEKSKLVDSSGLEQIRKAAADAADAKAVAKLLIQRGVLTKFQATQLLSGRHALVIGPYRLMDRVMSSGTGSVYAAQSTETKKPLTLKVLPRKLLADKETATKLKQQIDRLKKLDHPGFSQVVAVRREGGQTLLQMELDGGESLGRRVARDGPLSFEAVGECVKQAADALTAAHNNGLVHGDLTPDHLICDKLDRLQIVDLGFAEFNSAGPSADYAAPETSGNAPAGPSADIYSLGCILYFLLTGKPPFPDGTAEEKRRKHEKELPANVLEFRPDAPPDLMKLCIRMMAKKPEQRPKSAASVVATLGEWLFSQTSAAGGESSAAAATVDPSVRRALAKAEATGGDDDEPYDLDDVAESWGGFGIVLLCVALFFFVVLVYFPFSAWWDELIDSLWDVFFDSMLG